jgi:hypothetical protein
MAGGGLFMADLESVIDVVHEFLSCVDTESFTEAIRQGVDSTIICGMDMERARVMEV